MHVEWEDMVKCIRFLTERRMKELSVMDGMGCYGWVVFPKKVVVRCWFNSKRWWIWLGLGGWQKEEVILGRGGCKKIGRLR